MKILLTAIFFLQSAWAQSPGKTYLKADEIVYNPGKFKPGRYVISYKDFEDIRLDSNLDGKIDFWYLKKGSTEIYTHFTDGNPIRWEVRTNKRNVITEASYTMAGGRWTLEASGVRAPTLMNLQDEGCEVTAIKKKITSLGDDLNRRALAMGIEEHLIDSGCQDKLSEDFLQSLTDSLSKNLTSSNKLTDCLNGEEFKKAFSKDKIPVQPELLAAKYQLQVAQLGKQPKNYGPLVKCEKAKDQKAALSTDETTGFIHLDPEALSGATPETNKKSNAVISPSSMAHELLHRAGLKSEKDVAAVEHFCKGHPDNYPKISAIDMTPFSMTRTLKKNAQDGAEQAATQSTANLMDQEIKAKANANKFDKGMGSAATSAAVKGGSQQAAAASTANVPVELTVAQVQVPPAPTLSESIVSPPPSTEAGSQQALVRSASESGGMLRMANNLVGAMNTQALAATDAGSSEAGSGSSEVSRSVASTKSNAAIKGSSSNPGAALLKASTRSMASDERVVEQITLDGSNIAPSAPAAASSSRNVASTSAPSASRAPANESSVGGSGGGEVAGGSASFGGGGGSYSGSGAGASLGSAPAQSPVRGPAATRPSGGGTEPVKNAKSDTGSSAPSAARDEVITFISNSNYAQAKKKLSDPAFGKQLESQKITVLDLYGNSFGATKGEVIFLDQGDRFVRQK
ncbi:hypothetical protein ACES2J_00395 [Bdellovibrio bacteriovorus]|uniref:hypothetical protein n=1 Tax=Bdellovibrio bacteriovorus TaxID=959 RepID=UPI0035A609AB